MRVLLAGGGSGGSATPLLAVASELRRRDPNVTLLFLGTKSGPEMLLAAAEGIAYQGVSAGKLRRYWSAENVSDLFRTTRGLAESIRHVRRFRPDVAFGAGGFASVPPLSAAALLRVPVLIHQQDVVPGLANRLLTPFARRITVAMPETVRHFPAGRTVLRGNPIRPTVLQGDPSKLTIRLSLDKSAPLVLVTGGGTGALRLNRIIAAAAPALTRFCQVLHLSGRGRSVPVGTIGPRYVQREFLIEEMPDALAAAALVITRGGMGTLSELAALGKPTVIVPMPSSHQEANAAAFADRGAAVVRDERSLGSHSLVNLAHDLLEDGERRASLAAAIKTVMPADAAEQLADDLTALSDSKNAS